MRISDWSSDVCSSDLGKSAANGGGGVELGDVSRQLAAIGRHAGRRALFNLHGAYSKDTRGRYVPRVCCGRLERDVGSDDERGRMPHGNVYRRHGADEHATATVGRLRVGINKNVNLRPHAEQRSEEHTSELQSLMRISYAVFCLNKKKYT